MRRPLYLLVLAVLLLAGCGIGGLGADDAAHRGPFEMVSTWSRDAASPGLAVRLAGDAYGHRPGQTSDFSLTLRNDTPDRWEGRYCVFLLHAERDPVTLAQKPVALQAGEEVGETVAVAFPEDAPSGSYGLGVAIPGLGNAVSTIWVGEAQGSGRALPRSVPACPRG